MAYRLLQAEPISLGLRRIVREEIESAILHLRVEDESKRDDGIHEARKSIKKLRGVVRLLMPSLGESGLSENVALRDIGRSLSVFRDAAAGMETVDALAERLPPPPAAKHLAGVRMELERRRQLASLRHDGEAVANEAVFALRAFRRRAAAWQIPSETTAAGEFALLAPGLRLAWQRGRKALARVRQTPDAERFHDLRKRVKDHWYHVRMLEGVWSASADARERSLRDLQEWLGDDHNLTVLRELINAEPASFGTPRAIASVNALIDAATSDLRAKALELGGRLYAEKTGRLMSRTQELWTGWRTQPVRARAKATISVPRRKTSAA